MNINYQFSNIIGTVYKNGSVGFMADGHTLLAPNGNYLKALDLKKNNTRVLTPQLRSNITKFDTNFAGTHAFIATETGDSFYINLLTGNIIHRQYFSDRITVLKFSPNGRFIAIGITGSVIVYSIASLDRIQFNPFTRVNKFPHSTDHINSIDWSHDGRLIAAAGQNRVVKVFPALKSNDRIGVYIVSERAPLIDARFFDGYNLICCDKYGNGSVWEGTTNTVQQMKRVKSKGSSKSGQIAFERKKRFDLNQIADLNFSKLTELTAFSFNKSKKLMVTGFNNGVFCIFGVPGFNLLQNFKVGDFRINCVDINFIGNWVALGCGQGSEMHLLIWEWQSKSYILKQQSHNQTITAASYSPDGSLIATGAEDGKVKIWKCSTSFCVVTFTEHEVGVSDLCFTQSGKALLSASLEGSVRAHDLKRYRNFQTMAAPKQTQLNSLCADKSGDLVMASSRDLYEIYIWSLETGQLLEVLCGHTNIVAGLTYCENTLYSVSHDKTIKIWNIVEGTCIETIQMLNEGLDIKHSPAGTVLAVLCYDSAINLFDALNNQQLGTIETRLDIDSQRQKTDKIRKSTSERNKSFTCIAFSPDGTLILAAGQSNIFCLYSVADRIRIRTFKLSINLSLDGIQNTVNSIKVTEFGNIDLFDLSDSDENERNPQKKLRLPGTRHTDIGERSVNPAINILKLAFSPTGIDFAVVSTEGVAIYSLNRIRRFDPFLLEPGITPASVVQLSCVGEYAKAISLALRLNDSNLTRKVLESVPISQIGTVVQGIELVYVERLLAWLVSDNGHNGPTHQQHFHFYQILIREILQENAHKMKGAMEQNRPILTAIQQLVSNQQNLLMKLCDQNSQSLDYLVMLRKMESMQK